MVHSVENSIFLQLPGGSVGHGSGDGGFLRLSTDILFLKSAWVPAPLRAQYANSKASTESLKGCCGLVVMAGRGGRGCWKPSGQLMMLCSSYRDGSVLKGKASFLGMDLPSPPEMLLWTSDTPCPWSRNPAWGSTVHSSEEVQLWAPRFSPCTPPSRTPSVA